ncbi:MAG: hypothetical protein N0E48_10595, partial [Candidatus Thiodiazotropha endolucinida]|nr:hypothetical protein [Candidatus Thiodiazotropha taylori]MCW4343792.1 hypothetical protein [Candidatus Thiodiazotropha endolucinida]
IIFQEEFEILGDACFPNGRGAFLSRQSKKNLKGLQIKFIGESKDFPKGTCHVIVHHINVLHISN